MWPWRRRDADLDEEIQSHLRMAIRDRMDRGETRADAERAAAREFGNVGLIKETTREMWGWRWIERLMQDLRYGIRMMRRTPGFSAVAILSLALGIGANTLVFSIVNSLVLAPLPVGDPGRVFSVQGPRGVNFSYPFYRDLRDRAALLDGLIGYRVAPMSVESTGDTARAWGYLATGNYFDVLGVTPQAGRFFHQHDDLSPGGSPYAVLSDEYWTAHFARDPRIVGATIRINRLPCTVLGIAPAGFHGTEIFYRSDVWVPMMMQAQIEAGNPWLEERTTGNTWVAARIKNGATPAQVEANLNAIAAALGREHPATDKEITLRLVKPGLAGDTLRGPVQAFAFGVLLLAALVLVAASVNLASMLAARGADRQREMAIRVSLGAGRLRLVRQLLTETLLFAFAGGAAGYALAAAAARMLSAWRLFTDLPVQFDVRPDGSVFVFALVASTLAGVMFGLAPARQASAADPSHALKGGVASRRSRWAFRDVLVAVQVAVCVMLVSACLLSLRGLQKSLTMPLGFDARGVTIVGFDLGLAGYSEADGARLQERLRDEVARLPGVRTAAYSNSVPLSVDQSSTNATAEDRPLSPESAVTGIARYQVSPGFFNALGVRLLAGREFAWSDRARSLRVAIVNERFARTVFGTSDAVGRRFRYGWDKTLVQVVGVVENGKYVSLTENVRPAVFDPILQRYNSTTVLFVRSDRADEEMAPEMRRAIARVDPSLGLYSVGSVDRLLALVRFPSRAAAAALSAFGLLAILLAATGIHGIVAYAVAQRRRELGIRIAIGASRVQVLRLVLSRTATLLAAGAFVGVLLAMAAAQLLASIVYQASSRDPLVIAGVCATILAVGIAASWGPARRSLCIDPVTALRTE